MGTEAGQLNPDNVIEPREQRKLDKSIIYGIVAADEAIKDAGLDSYEGDKTRIGVSIGSGIGGLNTIYCIAAAHVVLALSLFQRGLLI